MEFRQGREAKRLSVSRRDADLVGAGRGAHPAGGAPVPVPGRQWQQPHVGGSARCAAGVDGGALRHPGGTAAPADCDDAKAVPVQSSQSFSSLMASSDLPPGRCVDFGLPCAPGLAPLSANQQIDENISEARPLKCNVETTEVNTTFPPLRFVVGYFSQVPYLACSLHFTTSMNCDFAEVVCLLLDVCEA